jgi:hypothetical protein
MSKLIYPGISILNIDKTICSGFLDFIKEKESELDFDFKLKYTTINGYQTKNLIDLIQTENPIATYLKNIKSDIESHIDARFEYYWIHVVSYQKEGFQEKHKHSHNEDCSFILYLNDCSDGETNFYVNPERNIQYKITPECGKMVVFSSSILHDSEKTNQNKKVLVGGLKIVS